MDDDIQGKITGDEELSALNSPPLETIEDKGFLSDADSVIRKFNHNTMWLVSWNSNKRGKTYDSVLP